MKASTGGEVPRWGRGADQFGQSGADLFWSTAEQGA